MIRTKSSCMRQSRSVLPAWRPTNQKIKNKFLCSSTFPPLSFPPLSALLWPNLEPWRPMNLEYIVNTVCVWRVFLLFTWLIQTFLIPTNWNSLESLRLYLSPASHISPACILLCWSWTQMCFTKAQQMLCGIRQWVCMETKVWIFKGYKGNMYSTF